MFLNHFLFLFPLKQGFLRLIILLIEVVARVIFLKLFCLEIVVIDLAVWGLARFPGAGQWRFQTLLRYVEQCAVIIHVHAKVARVFLDLRHGRLIVLRQLLLEYFESLSDESVPPGAGVETAGLVLLLLPWLVVLVGVHTGVVLFIVVLLFIFIAVDLLHGHALCLGLGDELHVLLVLLVGDLLLLVLELVLFVLLHHLHLLLLLLLLHG